MIPIEILHAALRPKQTVPNYRFKSWCNAMFVDYKTRLSPTQNFADCFLIRDWVTDDDLLPVVAASVAFILKVEFPNGYLPYSICRSEECWNPWHHQTIVWPDTNMSEFDRFGVWLHYFEAA